MTRDEQRMFNGMFAVTTALLLDWKRRSDREQAEHERTMERLDAEIAYQRAQLAEFRKKYPTQDEPAQP